jgi:hypothetical protein
LNNFCKERKLKKKEKEKGQYIYTKEAVCTTHINKKEEGKIRV